MTGQLGDVQADIINVLALVMGKDKAEKWVADLEHLIESKAKAGAEQSIPLITSKVESTAKKVILPMVAASIGVGGLALILSMVALRRSRRPRT